jgi:hypothetical protein
VNSLGANALFEFGLDLLGQRLLDARGWTINSRVFPQLDISFRATGRQELRLQLDFDDWNDSPPSVALLAPDGSPLERLPQMRPGNNIFNASAHARTRRPFVCMAGVREYHEHPSHTADLWIKYKARPDYDLGGILDLLWSGWDRVWP